GQNRSIGLRPPFLFLSGSFAYGTLVSDIGQWQRKCSLDPVRGHELFVRTLKTQVRPCRVSSQALRVSSKVMALAVLSFIYLSRSLFSRFGSPGSFSPGCRSSR